MDVAMTRTDFFTRLGADGHLGKNGVFTFNNTKSKQENFQSLRMPNTFLFKGKTINARQFITDMNIMPKTEAPIQISIPKIKQGNNYNTFNSYNTSQIQQGKPLKKTEAPIQTSMPKIETSKQQPQVNPQGIDNNGACESLKQTCPCLKKCF